VRDESVAVRGTSRTCSARPAFATGPSSRHA
jgi:hypothetical protein